MPIKRNYIVYTSFLCTAAIAAALILCSILSFNRVGLINYIVQISGKPYLLTILQQQIITPKKFSLIKLACYILLATDVAAVTLLYYYRGRVTGWLRFVGNCVSTAVASVMHVFAKNSKQNNIAFAMLLAVIISRSLYYILHFELQYDEMWSYNYFTARPFYFSIFSYNNYPLYELTTQLFKWLPFSMKINLRLPALLAGIACCVLIYACIKNYTGHALTALAGLALLACMPVTTFYMLYARGVMFQLLFALISVFSILYALKSNNYKKWFTVYVIANIAAIYSMPTHVYFWVVQLLCIFVYMATVKTGMAKAFIWCNALILAISFACYLPVIAGSGISFVINAATGTDTEGDVMPRMYLYNKVISAFFTGSAYGLSIIVAVTVVLLAVFAKINRRNVFFIAFVLLLYLLPLTIYLLQHKMVPERALAFIGFIIPICFCLLIFAFKNNVSPMAQTAFICIAFTAGCIISNNHTFMRWSEVKDKHAIGITTMLMQHRVKTCYDNSTGSGFFYFYPALEYYYGQKGLAIGVNMAAPNSLRYKPLVLADDYDCIVLHLSDSTGPIRNNYAAIYLDSAEDFKIMLKQKLLNTNTTHP